MYVWRVPITGDFAGEYFHHHFLRDEVAGDEGGQSVAPTGDEAGLFAKRSEGFVSDQLRCQCLVAALQL